MSEKRSSRKAVHGIGLRTRSMKGAEWNPYDIEYEVGTPASFGFVEWNGRSLTDNAPDVTFRIAANAPVGLGTGKASVTAKPSKVFPYMPSAA